MHLKAALISPTVQKERKDFLLRVGTRGTERVRRDRDAPDTSRSLTRSLINSHTPVRSLSSEVHDAFLTGENCRAIKSSEDEHFRCWN